MSSGNLGGNETNLPQVEQQGQQEVPKRLSAGQRFLKNLNGAAEKVLFWRRAGKKAEETGSIAALANSNKQEGSVRAEERGIHDLGQSFYLGTEIINIGSLFPGNKVVIDGVEHELSEEDLELLVLQQEEEATQRKRVRRKEEGEKKLAEEKAYDFSTQPNLEETVTTITEEARNFSVEQLRAHGVDEEEIQQRTAYLKPHFLEGSVSAKDDRENEEDENPRMLAGEVDKSGLICIYPDSEPNEEMRPFTAMIATAHEMDHAGIGAESDIDDMSHEQNLIIKGLDRHNVDTNTHEGELLENAFAELDSSRIYARLRGTSSPVIQQILQRQSGLVEGMTPETVQILSTDPQYSESREDWLPIYRKVIAAKNLGIPSEWIEAHIPMPEMEGLDQIVILWKLARMIGYKRAIDSGRKDITQEQFVEEGLFFLEESRIQGTDDAHTMIHSLFSEEDGNTILGSSEHPFVDERERILRILQVKEQQINPDWARAFLDEESDLY